LRTPESPVLVRKPVQVAGPELLSLTGPHGLQLLIGMIGADSDTAAAVDLDPDAVLSA